LLLELLLAFQKARLVLSGPPLPVRLKYPRLRHGYLGRVDVYGNEALLYECELLIFPLEFLEKVSPVRMQFSPVLGCSIRGRVSYKILDRDSAPADVVVLAMRFYKF